MLQMSILDGNAYDAKCLEAGQERDEDLEACSLLINNKQQALLVPSAIASHSPTAKVIVQLTVSLLCTRRGIFAHWPGRGHLRSRARTRGCRGCVLSS